MSPLSAQEKPVLDWLASQREAMLGLTAELVAIDSGKELLCALMTAAILVTWR